MPYIKDENNRREELKNGAKAEVAGELNCQIFVYLRSLIEERSDNTCIWNSSPDRVKLLNYVQNFLGKNPRYQDYNNMVGALLLCTKEFKRRFGLKITELTNIIDMYDVEIGKYENLKITQNGDVK